MDLASSTIKKPMIWMSNALYYFLSTSQKIVFHLQAILTGKKLDDTWKIPGPIHIPYLGTKWIFFWRYKVDKLHEAYSDIIERYGEIVRETSCSGYVIIHIANKSDIEKVLRYPSKYPIRAPSELIKDYRLGRPDRFSSGGMSLESGELWHDLRSKLTPELTSKKTMLGFLPELNNITDDFIQILKTKRNQKCEVESFDEYAKMYSLECNCTLVLGQRMSFFNTQVSEMAQKLSDAMTQRHESERDSLYKYSLEDYKKLPEYEKYLESEDVAYTIISDIVEKANNSNNDTYTDVQSILMSVIGRTGVDDKEKKSTLIDFIAAGISTLSSSLMMLLYLLSKNPEAQEKLYEELNELSPNFNYVSAQDLNKMAYTKACMLESFRLLPVAFVLSRILDEDMELSGYNIPAGTSVLCHTKIACENEKYFNNAKEFVPERWLDNNKESQNAATCLFSPFGHGKRMCPGKRFVEQAMLVTVAKIVHEFKIEHEGDMDIEFAFILHPKIPVKFTLKNRH